MATETIISIVFSIITVGVAVATFLIGRKTAAHTQGKEDGRLESDMNYIKERLDDIQKSQDDIFSRLNRNAERLTRVEESAKDTHNRIERLEAKVLK